MIITGLWHRALGMHKYEESWHANDVQDELAEYREAQGVLGHWSELSDVVYTVTRAWSNGYTDIAYPLPFWTYPIGLVYMYPKITLRFLFYRVAGHLAGAKRPMHECRNPKKIDKLERLAKLYDLDPDRFIAVCKKLLRFWPLLK